MKEWRVILVLLAVIALLSTILGVKIINNTPEKQLEKLNSSYNGTEYESIENESIENYNIGEMLTNVLKQAIGVLVAIGLVVALIIISNIKIYNKLGINGGIITVYIISCIVSFVAIFTFNETLSAITSVFSGIVSIILLVLQYKAIGVNPYLLLLVFIPIVGLFCVWILGIYAQCKLADYFGKGTGFKLGLIFLPMIFIPILAFSSNE